KVGSLYETFSNIDRTIEKLTIIGRINDSDICAIRALAGQQLTLVKNGNSQRLECVTVESDLQILDLSQAVLMHMDGDYYYAEGFAYIFVSDDIDWIRDHPLGYEWRGNFKKYEITQDCIGKYMFKGLKKLQTIILPNHVSKIDTRAFFGSTSLIEINNTDNIINYGDSVFYGCSSLSSFKFNDQIEEMGKCIFGGCTNLSDISLPSEYESIKKETFANCTNLANISIPESVRSIGIGAFKNCTNLTNIRIPKSVVKLDKKAFYGCTGLTSIDLPKSIKTIADSTFYNTNIRNVYCHFEERPYYFFAGKGIFTSYADTLFLSSDFRTNYDSNNPLRYYFTYIADIDGSNVNYANEYNIETAGTFGDKVSSEHRKSIRALKLNGKLNTDDISNLQLMPNLKLLDLSESNVTGNIIMNGSPIEYIIYPNNATVVAGNAFKECASLKKVVLPSSINQISLHAFYNCRKLEEINLPDNLQYIYDYAFWWCVNLKDIKLPSRLKKLGKEAFWCCENLTEITIPTSLDYIDDSAFYWCSRLKKVNLHSKIKYINKRAFYNCIALEKIEIPKQLNTIGEEAFYKCTSLSQLTFEKTNFGRSISYNAFSGCSSLTNVEFASLDKIGSDAFRNCKNLTKVTFNKGNKIESGAFTDSPVKSVYCYDSTPGSIKEDSFDKILNLTLYVPENSITDYKKSTWGKIFTKIEIINE
ncbi:leucine-rich repeat domain-containing protein, partial [uncultured Bacteroides sp.]|uniref:leucine-rich repeat domain-containing protein n=2 Tax=uncultured Bacteroides sp. TaxID=162156 RepID=UPI002614446B